MATFSKTASFNDLVPILPALELPETLRMLFSHRNFVHALAGAVVSYVNYDSNQLSVILFVDPKTRHSNTSNILRECLARLTSCEGSVTAMTVFYPLDTARTRLQVDDKRKAKNTAYVLLDIIHEEGLQSLYRGLLPVLCSLYCSNFLYFYTFNGLKTVFVGKGIVNVLLTTPLWVVNTRLKLQGATFRSKDLQDSKTKKYNGIIDGLQKVSREEGMGALWSGTGPSLILAGNPAVQFMVYEATKKFLMSDTKEALRGRQYFALGAIAKAVSTIMTYPLQVAQCRQRSGHKTPSGKADFLSQMTRLVREQGPMGMYKGLEAKLLQTVLTAALMFVAYEKIAAFIFRLLRGSKR
ncbi:Peroxisomal membrane protein PMP34 [Acropora cervicornis]|uniref:Peroxisomal membrane protein PMP34 n=1 Tax=Acropora cervicornis TaxID=6130 RepID=A0AAD9QXK2_ACRCE|nr:Peroxisomal membrane protein PMP34 [Acropora cervicornis]